ncbi:hypothetical protein B0H14DRAFT_2561472 [Mycena olivaceomarginata]|nr:hypothetical protein B0H14DRAFT_2561472 [Mycena olivaceomarginata]
MWFFPASPPGRGSTIGGPSREITSGPPVLGMISIFPLWPSDTECFPQNSTITTSTAERIRLAGAAIDVAIDKLDAEGQFDAKAYGVTGNLYSQMAQFDIAADQTKYMDKLEQFLLFQERMNNNFSNPTSFGHAAANAYAAYKNPVFLQYAIESWWVGRRRTISPSDLSAGTIAGKNFTLTKVCEGVTMAGGTFVDDRPGEFLVTGAATGVSALLAEATSDPTYLQAANESANFIRSHLYSFRNIVQEIITVDVNDEFACQVVVNSLPSNSGLMIEGLSILASITNSASTEKLGPLRGYELAAGPRHIYVRNSTNSTLRQYVGDYIAVQFNAVTNLATSNNTNIYGSTWTGPPNATFGGDSQTTALGALLSAIALETPSSLSSSSSVSPSPTNSPSPIASTPRPKSPHLGAILAGVLGGLAVLISMILWYLHRQRSTRNTGHSSRTPRTPPFLTSNITPFTTQTSIMTSPSPGKKNGEHRGLRPPSPTHVAAIPIHPLVGQETHQIESVTNIADEDRVNVNVEDSTASVLPTEMLLRILNQRMQRQQWGEGDNLPEYATVV